MQKCSLDMNLRILYYSSLTRKWGRGEQKGMEVTEKQIRNLCYCALWKHDYTLNLFLEMVASPNTVFV